LELFYSRGQPRLPRLERLRAVLAHPLRAPRALRRARQRLATRAILAQQKQLPRLVTRAIIASCV
jgi:hypothetical protein